MSEPAQITQISDNVNQGYIAGRDLYLGDQYVVQETLFFEPDLAGVEPPAWTTTSKAAELCRTLAVHRLIVLAGQDMDDKTMVARHVAWLLRQELAGEVRVREWYRSSDPQKVETAFHESETTILLLPQIQPHHVGHRLSELIRALQTHRNYAVITTDGTRADWGIRSGSPEEGLWREISWESYYGRSFLADTLIAELAVLNGSYPEWLPRNLQPGSAFTGGLTVEEVAARLKQPERIQRFAQWLQSEEATPRTLLAQLDQLSGDGTAIHQWYRQLAPSDQILALGLVLFDGLPDDQIFAAVEYLVDSAWRRTDPNLPLFDYRDLVRLGTNFHLIESGADGARIETSSRRKRKAIFQAAWELQRRRLLAVVPAMTRLIKQLSPATATPPDEGETVESGAAAWRRQLAQVGPGSEDKPKSPKGGRDKKKGSLQPAQEDADAWRFTQGPERELFSSPRRVEQLQRAVIESLSQIGLLSFEGVEASFLELAAGGSLRVQTVVAKALAAWRGDGHHDQLFRVLQAWWQAGCRTTPPQIVTQRVTKGADPLAGIRATVALAIGYALQYDPPNQLAPELQGLLRVVVLDHHPAIRQRVLELTLPLAAASHPQQLEELLRERLGQDQEQMYAIAFGIAMAFTLHPFGALRVLDSWHVMVRSQGGRDPEDRAITLRDRLLSAVAMAYGHIRCEPSQALLSTEQAVAALRSILTTETHPFVRTHALMAAGLQGLHNFELVAPLLLELLSEIALPDRKNVVAVFVRAYLKQREQIQGGDGEIEVDGRTYQIWLLSPRPLTRIETSLYSWLRDGHHPVARQVAAQTFAAFSQTELEQKERALGIAQKKIIPPSAPPAALRVAENPDQLRRLPILGYIATHLSAPFQRQTRDLVRPVLAEMLSVERFHAHGPHTLLDRWRSSGDEEVQGLARSTAAAFRLYQWRWVLILTLVLCAVVGMNWRDWRWSHQEPLPADEVAMMFQRRNLPFRFAWARRTLIFPPPPEAPKETQRPEAEGEPETQEKPPRIPADLSERVLWSSIRTLERRLGYLETDERQQALELRSLRMRLSSDRLSEEERSLFERRIVAWLLLDAIRSPKGEETRQTSPMNREEPGAQTSGAVPPRAVTYPVMDEAAPEELRGPSSNLTRAPVPPVVSAPKPPIQLEPEAQRIEIRADPPSMLERIRKSFNKKKKPPQGDKEKGHDQR